VTEAHLYADAPVADLEKTVTGAPTPWNRYRVFFWARMACDLALVLNIICILRPVLVGDDWQIVVESWTWDSARAHLWQPHNEHSMPLGRLSIWLMGLLAWKQTNVPLVMALQGPLALIAAMVMVYLLVRRESEQPLRGLLALALFGVSTRYENAINWFSASFTLLALDTFLLGLLAAQRWRQTGRFRHLVASAFWCVLAPGWFGSGVLAGPLCMLYLLVSSSPYPGLAKLASLRERLRDAARRILLPALVPLLGTLISLAITLPLNGKKIMDLPRVEQPVTAWETFKPQVGLEYTLRSMVDDLIPGAIGFKEFASPIPIVKVVWFLFLTLGLVWWWQAPHRPLLVVGLAIIVSSYMAIYTVRAYFEYEEMHHWSRYHLFAHLGLVLFLCGVLPRRLVAWVDSASPRMIDLGAACFLVLLFVTQVPRAKGLYYNPQQYADLERVEDVDVFCRKHGIAAATAREALPEFKISGMSGEVDGRPPSGWDMLRGSSDPQPMTVEEARDLLKGK
jgi:hypothetical protein